VNFNILVQNRVNMADTDVVDHENYFVTVTEVANTNLTSNEDLTSLALHRLLSFRGPFNYPH
jgi:hypothetical protein